MCYELKWTHLGRMTEEMCHSDTEIALGWHPWTLRFWHVLLDQQAQAARHMVGEIGSS